MSVAGILRWHSLPHITVAAVSGHALAGGAVLSNASDFRVGIAGSKAQFGAIEVPVVRMTRVSFLFNGIL